MELTGLDKLKKLKRKNKGNKVLQEEIDELIRVIKKASWSTPQEVKIDRPDADCVHTDGFYFFDIHIHRTMILLEFNDDEASIVWADSHDNYEKTFKNNKSVIKKWLKSRDYI